MAAKKKVSKNNRYFPIISISALILISMIFLYRHYRTTPYDRAVLIAADINLISNILSEIDKTCSILNFKYDRNYIDFLTVKDFVGSEVGSLNLAYPQNWKGPYVKDNPVIEGKVYEVVQAKDGYFIVPGKDVVLPNRYVMGKDVTIDKDRSIAKMLDSEEKLNYKGIPLARKIEFKVGDWKKVDEQLNKEDINQTLKELGAALPFTDYQEPELQNT